MTVGNRSLEGRQEYVQYYKNAISIKSDVDAEYSAEIRQIESIARELDIFIVSGLIEKEGGTLYCAVAFFSPSEGFLYSRRKVGAKRTTMWPHLSSWKFKYKYPMVQELY